MEIKLTYPEISDIYESIKTLLNYELDIDTIVKLTELKNKIQEYHRNYQESLQSLNKKHVKRNEKTKKPVPIRHPQTGNPVPNAYEMDNMLEYRDEKEKLDQREVSFNIEISFELEDFKGIGKIKGKALSDLHYFIDDFFNPKKEQKDATTQKR